DLIRETSGVAPALAFLAPAANMRNGVDEAAIDQREQIRIELGRKRERIRAVALEEQRGGTVEPGTVAVKQRDRNGFFVLGRNRDPPHHVGGRIVAAWHLLLLAQDARLALDIVVEGLLRGGRRRIAKANGARIELVHGAKLDRMDVLAEPDCVLVPVRLA